MFWITHDDEDSNSGSNGERSYAGARASVSTTRAVGGPRALAAPPPQADSPGYAHKAAPSSTDSARGSASPVTHTRTLIYATRAAHKGGIKPLCAALCFLTPSLVCDMGRGMLPCRCARSEAGRRVLPCRCARSEAASAAGADGYWCRWALSAPRAVGHYRRRALSGAATPTRVVGMSARCPHRRALLTPTRVISPSRC